MSGDCTKKCKYGSQPCGGQKGVNMYYSGYWGGDDNDLENLVLNLIYSVSPKPGAWTITKEGKRLKILSASIQETEGGDGVLLKNQFAGCGLRSLKILEVQPEGKKIMPFGDYLRGKNFLINERIFD